MEDLERGIELNEEALALRPGDHIFLNSLATGLQRLFEQKGSIDDLNRAIAATENALELAPDEIAAREQILGNMSNSLLFRYAQTGSKEDINRAIQAKEQCVALMPSDHPELPAYLTNLSIALELRYKGTGSKEDLDRSVEVSYQAIQKLPSGHPELPLYLNNFANSLESRFRRTGSIHDLDRAISTLEQAVVLTPNHHASLAVYLHSLASSLWERFRRMGSMADIDRSVCLMDRVIGITPKDHPTCADRFNTFGNALDSRFERTRSIADLDRAIVLRKEAVTITPADYLAHALYLSNLGKSWQHRFKLTGLKEDLNSALEAKEQAVVSTARDNPALPILLNNLGNAWKIRFNQTGSMEDLNRALAASEEAVALIPAEHPDRAVLLINLSDSLAIRFNQTKSIVDRERALTAEEQAVAVTTAPPTVRIIAAISASSHMVAFGDHRRANSILRTGVLLLPMVSPRILKRSDQQYNISHFVGITSNAVSLSLDCGENANDALQLLELGRGVLASWQLEVRSDISQLEASEHSDLARRFRDLRGQLESPQPATMELTPFNSTSDSESRRVASSDFEALLATIRLLKGHEQFLLGPSGPELKALAGSGPIVVFNVSEIRADAFLINTVEIRSMRLPLLKHSELEAYTKRFLDSVNWTNLRAYAKARAELTKVLEWLWDVAVGPVLEELGFGGPPSHDTVWPRVWWIGCGLLTILPIHAAGYHDSSSNQSAIDRVISSYTPTLKSLSYARERHASAESLESQKVMLVGMAKTPEQGDIPFVETELAEVHKLLPSSIHTTIILDPTREIEFRKLLLSEIQTTVIPDPTKETVMSTIRDQQVIHFSCHGYSSVADPSQSLLLLKDWKTSPLTVSDLTSLIIQSPQLAYLSACHTASIRDFNLVDESINLSAAIQLAGYPSVVGTLWQVGDIDSVEVAKDVYEWMLDGGDRLNTRLSAEGLHRAVRSLRDRTRIVPAFEMKAPNDPLIWAPYIHVGV
jgi:tetratricopeptide (TPR) repeat protein